MNLMFLRVDAGLLAGLKDDTIEMLRSYGALQDCLGDFGFRGLEFRALLRVSGFHPKPYKDLGLGAWFRDLEKWSRAFRFGRGFIPGYAESCCERDLGVGFSILVFGLCFQDWSVVLWGLNVRIPGQGDANHGLTADSRISQQQDAGSLEGSL